MLFFIGITSFLLAGGREADPSTLLNLACRSLKQILCPYYKLLIGDGEDFAARIRPHVQNLD